MFTRTTLALVLASTLTLPLADSARAGITWQCGTTAPRADFTSDDTCASSCFSSMCAGVSLTCYDSCQDSLETSTTAAPSPDCECMVAGGRWDSAFKVCRFEDSSPLTTSTEDYSQERNDFGQATNQMLGLGTGQTNTSFYSVTLRYY